MHHAGVRFELDLRRELADGLRCDLAPLVGHQRVTVSVTLQDRHRPADRQRMTPGHVRFSTSDQLSSSTDSLLVSDCMHGIIRTEVRPFIIFCVIV